MKKIILLPIILFIACSPATPQQAIKIVKTNNDSIDDKTDSVKLKSILQDESELRIILHTKNDVQNANLKGKVKSILEIDYQIYPWQNIDSLRDIKMILDTMLPHSGMDSLMRKKERPIDPSAKRFVKYDINGIYIPEIINYSKGYTPPPIGLSNKKYNSQKQLIEYTTGGFTKHILKYDTNKYVIEATECKYLFPHFTKLNLYTVYTYNEGKIIKSEDFGDQGGGHFASLGGFDYYYSSDGYSIVPNNGINKISKTYDNHGNRIKETDLPSGKDYKSYVYNYDENDNLVNEVEYHNYFHNDGLTYTDATTYTYLNDKAGNWISKFGKTYKSSGKYENFITVTKRIIEYYPTGN